MRAAMAQACGSLALRTWAHGGHPGGVGPVGTESLSPSAEPEAQLEEQVGKMQGGRLGRGPALPAKVCTVSQAGLSLPRRKTGHDAN